MIEKFVFFVVLILALLKSDLANSQISIRIVAKCFKTDEVRIFYKSNKQDTYGREKSIGINLKGGESLDTLIYNLPIAQLEEIRIDFGLVPNRFSVRSLEIISKKSQSIWKGREIINGFIPNSNINITDSDYYFSFESKPYNDRFDPNLVINKNGINKMAYELYNSHTVIPSKLKLTISSDNDRMSNFWYVPESLQKEKYYSLPNRVPFFIKKKSNDTIVISIFSEGYAAAFCLDFGKGDSTSVLLNNLIFKDSYRTNSWTTLKQYEEFSPNENILTMSSEKGMKLDLNKSTGYVGPRIYYEFDMLKLAYKKNSFKMSIGSYSIYLNICLLSIVLSAFTLIIINGKILPQIKFN